MVKMNLLTIGSKKLLYSKLADKICNYITENGLKTGDKLPGERTLAAEWGVSRASLREAIRELEKQGIIEVEVGRGSFVAEPIEGSSVMITVAQKNFLELFEVKVVLERHIIESLTKTIPMKALRQLEILGERMNESRKSGIYAQELDHEFHQRLLDNYDNKEMVAIIWSLISVFEEFDKKYFIYYNKDFETRYNQLASDTMPYHLEMIKAMEERDVQKALLWYQKIIDIDMVIYGEMNY